MSAPLTRRTPVGMTGAGADIGRTHRCAMRPDDRFELQAGVFGRNADRSAALAAERGVPAVRADGDHRQMARVEAARPDGFVEAVAASHHAVAASLHADAAWTVPASAVEKAEA